MTANTTTNPKNTTVSDHDLISAHKGAFEVIDATDPLCARRIFAGKDAADWKVKIRQNPTMGVYRDTYWYDPAIPEAFSSPDEIDALLSIKEALIELAYGLPDDEIDVDAVRARARELLSHKLADRELKRRLTRKFDCAVMDSVYDSIEDTDLVMRWTSISPQATVGIDRLYRVNDYLKEVYGWDPNDRLIIFSSGADRNEQFLDDISFRDMLFADDGVDACLTFGDVGGTDRCLWLFSAPGSFTAERKRVLVGTIPPVVEDDAGELAFYEAIASDDAELLRRACDFVVDLLLHPREIEGSVGVFTHEEVAATLGEAGEVLPYSGVSFDYDDIVRANRTAA